MRVMGLTPASPGEASQRWTPPLAMCGLHKRPLAEHGACHTCCERSRARRERNSLLRIKYLRGELNP